MVTNTNNCRNSYNTNCSYPVYIRIPLAYRKGMIPQGRDTAITGACIILFIVLCIAILLRFLQKK